MTTLITGADGFIGCHLLPRVADPYALTREMVDLSGPLPALPTTETVIHCAAELDDVSMMRAVNVEATRRLVKWSRRSGVTMFVFLSTGGIGASGVYAATKREAEQIVLDAAEDLEVRVVRLYFAYGPGQAAHRLVPRLIERVKAGQPVVVDPRGGPFLSLTFIDDIVEGILRVCQVAGRVFDVGGNPVTMRELAQCIGRVVGREPLFEEREALAADFCADPSSLHSQTGFLPRVDLEDGIRATVGYARIPGQ